MEQGLDIIQSYILTGARYDFTVPQKRILYRIIELMQHYTEGRKLNHRYSINKTMFDDVDIVMPISAFLKHQDDKNYQQAKEALLSLNLKVIQVEDEKTWQAFNLIERPKIKKGDSTVSLRIAPEIAKAFLNFSKGYTKYQLITAMEFESVYAMRFYELLSGQKNKITYSIAHLKALFGIEDKYVNRNPDFFRFVIDVAKKELDKHSPYSFVYEVDEKTKIGKRAVNLNFHPVYISENRDYDLEQHELQKQTSIRFDLDKSIIDYLKENYFFSDQELKNNIQLFKLAQRKLPDFILTLSTLKAKALKANSSKGYIINSLKKILGIKGKGTTNHVVSEQMAVDMQKTLEKLTTDKNI
jgi:plasmid replication initiation protein